MIDEQGRHIHQMPEDSFFSRARKNRPVKILKREWINGSLIYFFAFE
jgi:hypothetical protein